MVHNNNILRFACTPQNTFNSTQPGQRGDWREMEGCYVLYPPAGRPPQAVAHFLGGAFVGAAPQVAYRLFLEALANRDVLVSAGSTLHSACTPCLRGHFILALDCILTA